jgi:hypothetical protein
MDFTCIVLFLALYYLKPQEWTSIFSTIRFVQLVMFASLTTLFFRERSLKAREFFRTPHDWAVYGFLLWIIISSLSPFSTFKDDILNRLLFYVVTVQTLLSITRLNKFLGWWTVFLVTTAFLAIAGEYFWDPLGSSDITNGVMKGRLVLNISTANNPNALAHALAPTLAMLYYCTYWKRSVFLKVLGIAGMVLVTFTIYLTESKGGFLAAGATIMAMFTFGRPKSAQIVIGAVLFIAGSSAMYSLPRMTELNRSKGDQAIQGRVASFTHGYQYYQSLTTGVGNEQFIKRQLADHKLNKAPHSVYVAIGAQQGKTGMFLFLLIMWANFRTLIFMKTQSVEQERARRILFTLVFSYAISGWMVDFAYRPSFFLFTAAIAVLHRLFLLDQKKEEETDTGHQTMIWKQASAAPSLAMPGPALELATPTDSALLPRLTFMQVENPLSTLGQQDAEAINKPKKKFSQGVTLLDIGAVLVLMKLVEMMWVYCINNM